MKRLLFSMSAMLIVFVLVSPAHASLITIGTAKYSVTGLDYNLIWDDDNNGNSVVWLDYTNSLANWTNQNNWASGLNVFGVLTYNLNPGYVVTWSGDWRLPTTVDDDSLSRGYDITNSEMGHLYYTELGKTAGGSLGSTGPFLNLIPSLYWSGTYYSAIPGDAWFFVFVDGGQFTYNKDRDRNGLAVRSGDVAAAGSVDASDNPAPVPEPTTIALLGIGLAGMGVYGVRRRRQLR